MGFNAFKIGGQGGAAADNEKDQYQSDSTISSHDASFVSLPRVKAELLTTNGRLVHQPALGAGLGLNTGSDRNRGGGCVKLEFPTDEFFIGMFVFEKDHIAECLSAQLKTDGHLD